MKTIIGRKIGMTQIFTENGDLVPVTVVKAGPVKVTQIKTEENDGYQAIQIGFEEGKEKQKSQAIQGHYEKAGLDLMNVLTEVRVDDVSEYEIGQEFGADIFEANERIDVVGRSKGKGTQGVIKRHNYSRGPRSHGSQFHRTGGARAAAADPGRVFPGTKGPGHMGNEQVTVQNLEVVRVDAENSVLLIKGAIPGNKNGLVRITETVKNK